MIHASKVSELFEPLTARLGNGIVAKELSPSKYSELISCVGGWGGGGASGRGGSGGGGVGDGG